MIPFHILFLFLTSALVKAQYPPPQFCFRSCEQALRSGVTFNTTNPLTGEQTCQPSQCGCTGDLAIPSLYLCAKRYCTEREIEDGLAAFNESCHFFANVSVPPFLEVVGRWSESEVEKLRRVRRKDAFMSPVPPVVSEVVLPDEEFYGLALDTLAAGYFEVRIHIIYGIFMYFFWFVVILIGLTSHFARYLAEQEQKWEQIPQDDPAALESSIKTKEHFFRTPYTLLKRYITVPATFGYTRSQNISWWATIPTRVQSIAIGAFVFLNVLLCSISYHVFEDNLYWRHISAQLLRYVADRTGVISTANLLLIWTFGIRNNTLMWLTGWDFATYNNFHRWVARVATVQAIVHSVAYTVMILEHHDSWSAAWEYYMSYYKEKYFWNGVLATIFMSLICLFSIYGLRRNYYETFLLLHIFLSIGVLITMWYHIEIFNGIYSYFMYPCFFIWISDRVLRTIRILLFNPFFWRSKAVVTYNKDSNIIRLTVPYSKSFIVPKPGTFYYISSLSSYQFWESHPFTLSYSTPSSVDDDDDEDKPTDLTPSPYHSHGTISPPHPFPSPPNTPFLSDQEDTNSQELTTPITPTSHHHHHNQDFESESLLKSASPQRPPPQSLTFLIRPYTGFTNRLRTSALHRPSTQRVILDGPYGETQPLHKYHNVLFLVGGAGIAVPLSYLSQLLKHPSSRTQSVKILWAVRESAFLQQTLEVDFQGLLGDERLDVCAFVTDSNIERSDAVSELARKKKGVTIHHGRPNVEDEIEEVAREVGKGAELAVVACGPGKMADDARRKVVRLLGRGWGKVEYFEESFNW